MRFTAEVEAEREEGLNVSKDLLAEEIVDQMDGVETESGTITFVAYEGSKKGQPMRFTVQFDGDGDTITLAEEIADEFLNLQLDLEAPNDTEATYSVVNVDVRVLPTDV